MQLRIHDVVVGIDDAERFGPSDPARLHGQLIRIGPAHVDLHDDIGPASGLNTDEADDVVDLRPITRQAEGSRRLSGRGGRRGHEGQAGGPPYRASHESPNRHAITPDCYG